MKLSDSKSNDINEILSNAKMLKLYGWEEQFKSKIQSGRDNEKSALK